MVVFVVNTWAAPVTNQREMPARVLGPDPCFYPMCRFLYARSPDGIYFQGQQKSLLIPRKSTVHMTGLSSNGLRCSVFSSATWSVC
jgi:hypothetical protein